ncbi:probable Protein transport protein SFT1 [Saccharomycodes ludwigii]|uniref:Probable Protein transport protein SFT1 n=1 Tax=Saccharomycodes ludwigii TaxID=36035 RepID=A0A376B8L8_9ASCO|nr:hypothetical protein SCDLUD_004100 [Saccharomycodes ludwigii]KAH3899807.1 hypothetical protein SCDLUD_004100 [Saccharomycodes ludwigii]SSD60909.1 probable Protein transport protein SFT1 [Saccharomycodes ludwigii]
MSGSKYAQVENRNNQRLDELANKLSSFRNINSEIGEQAEADNALLTNLGGHFDSLLNNIKDSSTRLTRSMNAGKGIWKMVGLALLAFFIFYILFKVF